MEKMIMKPGCTSRPMQVTSLIIMCNQDAILIRIKVVLDKVTDTKPGKIDIEQFKILDLWRVCR